MFLTHQSITTLCHLIKTFISYVIFFNFLSKLSVTNTCTWIKYKEYFGAKFLRKDFADKKFLSNFLDILQKSYLLPILRSSWKNRHIKYKKKLEGGEYWYCSTIQLGVFGMWPEESGHTLSLYFWIFSNLHFDKHLHGAN